MGKVGINYQPPTIIPGGDLAKFRGQCVCFPTLRLLLKLGLDWTTSSILCTPREPLSIGMWVRAWRKVSSPRLGKIWPLWKRIMKRLAWILVTVREMKEMSTRNSSTFNALRCEIHQH